MIVLQSKYVRVVGKQDLGSTRAPSQDIASSISCYFCIFRLCIVPCTLLTRRMKNSVSMFSVQEKVLAKFNSQSQSAFFIISVHEHVSYSCVRMKDSCVPFSWNKWSILLVFGQGSLKTFFLIQLLLSISWMIDAPDSYNQFQKKISQDFHEIVCFPIITVRRSLDQCFPICTHHSSIFRWKSKCSLYTLDDLHTQTSITWDYFQFLMERSKKLRKKLRLSWVEITKIWNIERS